MTVDPSLPESLQDLEPFALQSSDQEPRYSPGKFFVRPQEINDQDPLVTADDGIIATTTWFKTPSLDRHLTKYLKAVQLFAETHDQYYVGDRALGNWTWLELAIYENASSDTPRVKEGVKLVWQSHKNIMGSNEFVWLPGEKFGQQHDLLTSLEEGNVIAVRACARFRNWQVFGRNARLVLEIGEHENTERPPSYAEAARTTDRMLKLLNAQNIENDAYTPEVKTVSERADTYTGKGKAPLRVLSLDGGGVRGYSSLMILKEVMKSVGRERPCEVFDMIAGTSTGGLIALMLGRLKMTVQECLDEYSALMEQVFGSGWLNDYGGKQVRYIATGDFHSAAKFEEVTKGLLRRRLRVEKPEDALLLDEKDSCKIFLMAVRQESGSNRAPVFLRSYKSDSDPPDPNLANIKIWEAARATSAAPGYFEPMQIGKIKLVDGGLLANNPVGWLWTEVLSEYGQLRAADCFLSIGTGMAPNVPVSQPGLTFYKAMLSFASIATNTESTHLLFSGLINAFAPNPGKEKYWRLNVAKEAPEKSKWKKIWDGIRGSEQPMLNDYADPGDLDNVKAIEKLKKWTNEWIAVQKDLISGCSAAISKSLEVRDEK
ncbi:uncharacterized protein ACHE_31171S [Aspergillus chevalieri]|uniref:PNPLA domain-containing protein n=1 Tax=Aspergillus chevalieri TaxID=182096 RepID=A0A7R7ZN10_ASPCH|nr:uncharacterized protein ACHE_31171S [Aspergillus chevalieri]BCR87184.1 hypothetical protein ACHE_31171S [Aspergillus chevalieri]